MVSAPHLLDVSRVFGWELSPQVMTTIIFLKNKCLVCGRTTRKADLFPGMIHEDLMAGDRFPQLPFIPYDFSVGLGTGLQVALPYGTSHVSHEFIWSCWDIGPATGGGDGLFPRIYDHRPHIFTLSCSTWEGFFLFPFQCGALRSGRLPFLPTLPGDRR